MRRTMVVSVFAGCGKTWLTNHQNQYGYSMRDSDSSTYEKTAGWEKEYINSFMEEAKSGKYDFIFVCQTESVIDEMDRQKIPYVIVEPDNIVWNEQESKERAKERHFCIRHGFLDVKQNDTISIDGAKLYLVHRPIDCKPGMLNLYGHVHRQGGIWSPYGFNICADVNHFRLYSENDIRFLISQKAAWDNDADTKFLAGIE